jgi:alpha-tubulin suppressor-like RCC1 family protein
MKSLTVTEKVVDLSLGRTLAAAVDCKGMIWSWGMNEIGELGLGDSENRAHPSPMLALKSRKVT